MLASGPAPTTHSFVGNTHRVLGGQEGILLVVVRVLFVGPTSRSWRSIEGEVNADLERLARPGVEAKLVAIPVVGPGAALERAIAVAGRPVVRVSGDELRSLSVEELTMRARGAATVVLGGTGWSHISEVLTADQPDLVVLDPLAVALDDCLSILADTAVARHPEPPTEA